MDFKKVYDVVGKLVEEGADTALAAELLKELCIIEIDLYTEGVLDVLVETHIFDPNEKNEISPCR